MFYEARFIPSLIIISCSIASCRPKIKLEAKKTMIAILAI
jgi:hypothetical protein